MRNFKTLKKEEKFMRIADGELLPALIPELLPEYVSILDLKSTYSKIDFQGVYLDTVAIISTL